MAAESLVHIPQSQKDITGMVWPALGMMVILTFLGFQASTEYTAWALGWPEVLGAPIMGHWYAPWMSILWGIEYDNVSYGPRVLHVFLVGHVIMLVFGMSAILLLAIWAYRRTRKAAQERNDLHGSAHWATDEEVIAQGLLPTEDNRGGVFLGAHTMNAPQRSVRRHIRTKLAAHPDQRTFYLRHKGPEHIMVFAPTRSGKGVGIVIPTLLGWDESVLIHDIKGENWALTAGFRKEHLGQRCLKFCPTEPDSVRFNPLQEIRLDGNLIKDVQNIATMIVDPDGKGLNDHWAKTGFDLLTGVILYVLLSPDLKPGSDGKNLRCLHTVQSILSDGGPVREIAETQAEQKAALAPREANARAKPAPKGFQAVIEYIKDYALEILQHEQDVYRVTGWRAVAEASQSFLNKAPNEASGVLSTALSFLSLYRDPIVAENTRVSDFNIPSLMGGEDIDGRKVVEKSSLYLVVPPSDKDRLKPLLRLILNQMVRRLTEGMDFEEDGRSRSLYPHRMLLLLDEFPSLGKLDVFQEALAFIAGYGLKALLIVQDLSQLFAAYGKDESIISNCHVRVAYAPNKIETAELLSKMAGQATVRHNQRQYSGGRFSLLLHNVNTNEQIVQRPLLTPDECMRLPPDDELIFVAGHAPIYGQKIKYYLDEGFKSRLLKAPDVSGDRKC